MLFECQALAGIITKASKGNDDLTRVVNDAMRECRPRDHSVMVAIGTTDSVEIWVEDTEGPKSVTDPKSEGEPNNSPVPAWRMRKAFRSSDEPSGWRPRHAVAH